MARDGAHPGDRETPASPGNQESPSHSPFRLKTYIHAFSTIVLQPIDLYVCTAIMYLWSVKVGFEGYIRGCGLQFGNVSQLCTEDADFQTALRLAAGRTVVA